MSIRQSDPALRWSGRSSIRCADAPRRLRYRPRQTGHYTTLLGVIGLAIGIGAALSTTAAGLIADNFGGTTAFLGLTGAVLCATLLSGACCPKQDLQQQNARVI